LQGLVITEGDEAYESTPAPRASPALSIVVAWAISVLPTAGCNALGIVMSVEFESPSSAVTPISRDERQFHVAMGERIAQLRKARNLTQTQLAEVLGVAQQTVQGYEAGSRRIPVSTLPLLAKTLGVSLGVSLEVLFGEEAKPARSKRGPVPQWQEQMEAIARLPRAQQRFVTQMLQTMLAQQQGR
jgi:transcriptional regulator with XRE-family HTH domain